MAYRFSHGQSIPPAERIFLVISIFSIRQLGVATDAEGETREQSLPVAYRKNGKLLWDVEKH